MDNIVNMIYRLLCCDNFILQSYHAASAKLDRTTLEILIPQAQGSDAWIGIHRMKLHQLISSLAVIFTVKALVTYTS